jgi:hypothetical protein
MNEKQQLANDREAWQQLAPEESLPARALAFDLDDPTDRLLAVTLLGLPVSKEAA